MTDFLESFFLEDPRKLDDPFADLAWLREHCPVYHREALGQWFVFRYDGVEFFNVIPISEQATQRMMRTVAEMSDYFRALLAERRREPREDFLGTMIATDAAQEGMTDEEIVANTIMLLLAGHLPVRNAIGNTIWLLLSRPEQTAAVRSDLSLLGPALEEALRFEPPVTLIPRIAREDLEVAGVTIPAGAIIQLSIAAANRDPGRFPDPDVFDLNRDPHGVISFRPRPARLSGRAAGPRAVADRAARSVRATRRDAHRSRRRDPLVSQRRQSRPRRTSGYVRAGWIGAGA